MNEKYCECGCGQVVERYRGKWNRFILGHSRKGKKSPIEIRRKISKAHKGFKHSEETKRKISKHQTGRKLSEEHKKKIGITNTKCRTGEGGYCDQWFDIEFKKNYRKDHCEKCDRTEKDGWRMHLHHVDLNKTNCHPNNLQTLCVRCHLQLHKRLKRCMEN